MTGSGNVRSDIRPGLTVDIVLKKDQRSGATTRGVVKDILTNSAITLTASRLGCRTAKSAG